MEFNHIKTFSYQELEQGVLKTQPDSLNIISRISESRYAAFLSNPNLTNMGDIAIVVANVNEVPVGRLTIFPIKMIIDGNIETVMGGSDLYVNENYRQQAAGTDLMMYPILEEQYHYILYAGASPKALPIYKRLKYQVIEYPRMMQLRKSRSILESKGLHGFVLKITSFIIDLMLKTIGLYISFASLLKKKGYTIERVTEVPRWVDEILKQDSHKYKELHDQKWLQWNLDNHFTDATDNIQSFYVVKKDNEIMGYFMTKERYRELAGGVLRNIVIGSIVEWGSFDENKLSEKDINILAMGTFTKKIDILEFATNNEEVCKAMKKFFFRKHGFAHILFKDKQRKHKDASDISNWRIRYGYADVILS